MVQSAEYIYNKLISEELLSLAHNARPDLGTAKFPVVTTGHSLGAGTAALLAILLRYTLALASDWSLFLILASDWSTLRILASYWSILLRDREYPDVTCYAFSPPGGLIR